MSAQTTPMPEWYCWGCGEWVEPDHGGPQTGWGHTRSEHDPSGDPYNHDCSTCPIPVACGPVELTYPNEVGGPR